MFPALRFHYLAARYPDRRVFLDMGFGIEARYRRCKRHWSRHLEISKEIQQHLPAGERLAILGAGRLLDVNPELLQRFRQIDFYDADPSAQRTWRRFARRHRASGVRFGFYSEELTGCLTAWIDELQRSLRELSSPSLLSVAECVAKLRIVPPPFSRSYDAILSLNLLGQIPLYWRDCAQKCIADAASIDCDDQSNYQEPLQSALVNSMRLLQEQHLRLLGTHARRAIALISDAYFLYYDRLKSPWLEESALLLDPAKALSSWKQRYNDRWFWHIAPQGIEQDEYGVIHDMRGFIFERNESAS